VAELKTKKTRASVSAFVRAIDDPGRRADCETLLDLMRTITKEEPHLWGSSIVGFGTFLYKYDNGRTGEWPITGFSPRKQSLTIYLMDGFGHRAELMEKLGKHTTGQSCLYVKRLSDIDLKVLTRIVTDSFKATKARFAQKNG
jgi:hypothetical protein